MKNNDTCSLLKLNNYSTKLINKAFSYFSNFDLCNFTKFEWIFKCKFKLFVRKTEHIIKR